MAGEWVPSSISLPVWRARPSRNFLFKNFPKYLKLLNFYFVEFYYCTFVLCSVNLMAFVDGEFLK